MTPELITLRMTLQTRKTQEWMLTSGSKIYAVRIRRSASRTMFQTLRYVINRTLKLNSTDYMFLGNRFVSGAWTTEWFKHNDSLFDLEAEAHSLTLHNHT